MPPKRGRPKRRENDEPEESFDQRNSDSDNDVPMEHGQNDDIPSPEEDNSNENLKRQYDEDQDYAHPETKKTKVEYGDDKFEGELSEEQKLVMMEERMKREQQEKEEAEEKARVEEEERKKKEYEAMYTPDGKRRKSPELLKFWKAVEDDPNDFTGWTYLLQHVDASGILEHGREAYDQFLFRYPYCYGYWKKFADFEKKKGDSPEKCMMFSREVSKQYPLVLIFGFTI